jgi:hypothetical protein
MAIALVVAIGFLLMLWLVLSTVRRLRPGTFRLKATLTRWVSLDVEMHSPETSGGKEALDGAACCEGTAELRPPDGRDEVAGV